VNPLLAISTFAIDYWDTGGIVTWDIGKAAPFRAMLQKRLQRAVELRAPVAFDLPGYPMLLHERGIGSRGDSRREFQLECCGIKIGLSPRDSHKRQLYNYSCIMSGEACLVLGIEQGRRIVTDIISLLGGTVVDEWVKRIDLCLDVPGLSLQRELLPVFEAGHLTTTASVWNPWDGKKGKTGFTVSSRGRVTLNCYDKVIDVLRKGDGVYLAAMEQRRWHGRTPDAATRIEYQVRKAWLDSYQLRTAELVLEPVFKWINGAVRSAGTSGESCGCKSGSRWSPAAARSLC